MAVTTADKSKRMKAWQVYSAAVAEARQAYIVQAATVALVRLNGLRKARQERDQRIAEARAAYDKARA